MNKNKNGESKTDENNEKSKKRSSAISSGGKTATEE